MKVEKLWFENGRIYVTNDKGETLYQSLKFYPRLLVATDKQRAAYEFEPFGIHWEEIDEDMSYESFYYEDTKETAPGIQDAFLSHPELNISAVARRMVSNKVSWLAILRERKYLHPNARNSS